MSAVIRLADKRGRGMIVRYVPRDGVSGRQLVDS
jgi:hypothetical protein